MHGLLLGKIAPIEVALAGARPCRTIRSRGFMAATQSYRIPTVYESTATGLPPLRPYFAELWGRRRFIWHLARTDLKAEHYDSAIGQLWVILDPLLLAAVYFLLRTVVKPVGTGVEPQRDHRPPRVGRLRLHVREQRDDGRRALAAERARPDPERVVPARGAADHRDRQGDLRLPADDVRVLRVPRSCSASRSARRSSCCR